MPIAPTPAPLDDAPRMGSEYSSARSYLAQAPRSKVVAKHKPAGEPQHGSNDSDFGMMDQAAD